MRTKNGNKEREQVQYEQLILELPLHRPPARRREEHDDEPNRGVVVIDLY